VVADVLGDWWLSHMHSLACRLSCAKFLVLFPWVMEPIAN
jgi:hypothetical protein